jgi:hypothetical protein
MKVVDVAIPFGSVFILVLKAMIAVTIISVGLGLFYLMIVVLFLGGLLSISGRECRRRRRREAFGGHRPPLQILCRLISDL